MLPPEELAADLPPPRGDEPASLRQDILDELADHLQCALRRELLSDRAAAGRDADLDRTAAARSRVLHKFGDPARLARRLWLDAMQEKLMSQRLLTAALVVVTLLCVGLFLLNWQVMSANRALAEQQQLMNESFMKQIRQLAERPAAEAEKSSAPSEWNRLTVKCMYDGGEPASEVKVRVESSSDNTKGIPSMTKVTGPDGELDFGQVLYGEYRIEVQAGEFEKTLLSVAVHPGEDRHVEIICPRPGSLARVNLQLKADPPLPEELQGRLWTLLSVIPQDEYVNHWADYADFPPVQVLMRPDGKLLSGEKVPECVSMSQEPAHDAVHPLMTHRMSIPMAAKWSETIELPYKTYDVQVLATGFSPGDDADSVLFHLEAEAPDPEELSPARRSMEGAGEFRADLETAAWQVSLTRNDWQETWLALTLPSDMVLLSVKTLFDGSALQASVWKDPAHPLRVDLVVGTGSKDERRLLLRGVQIADAWDGLGRRTSGFDFLKSMRLILRSDEVEGVRRAMASERGLGLRPIPPGERIERGSLQTDVLQGLQEDSDVDVYEATALPSMSAD
jgi:hypothetical protein